tara:strand:- start:409 stop:660 length:252 start_codon:yes stop_codon:yes gene_type:complete
MYDSFLIRIAAFSLALLLIVCPAAIPAYEMDSLIQESSPDETVEAPNRMTIQQMNELFGEDPYLGQTSYLQSPDGFSQRDKAK